MELHQIKTFITVARTENVTRAAEQLHTTPPSVSNHIKLLEQELNVVLFTRTAKGMKITGHGRLLLEKAQKILDASKDLMLSAEGFTSKPAGNIRLGINAAPEILKVPEIICQTRVKYPDIRLDIVASHTDEIKQRIDQQDMDCGFAFGARTDNGHRFVFLSDVDLVIALPAIYQKTYQTASLNQIARLPWIVPENTCPFFQKVQSSLQDNGIVLENKVYANDDITKTTLVKSGAAVCVMEAGEARFFADKGHVCIWNGPQTFESSLWFVHAENRENDLTIQSIVSLVSEIWHPCYRPCC